MADKSLPVPFRRVNKTLPFVDSVFETTLDLNAHLTNPTRYAGQIVSLVEAGAVTVYKLNADEDVWLELGSSSSLLQDDINVLDVEIGSYEDGDVISAGTSLEDVLKGMLSKTIPPTYTVPTLSLSGSGTKNVEVGTLLTPSLTPSFNANDGGAQLGYELFKNATSIYTDSSATAYSAGSFTIGDENVIFYAEVDYDDGAVKNDNTGTPDPTGQILAGTSVSGNITYRGQRKAFYDVDGDIVSIRSNTMDTLNPSNGATFSFTASGGDIVLAYPDTLRDMTGATLTSSGFTFNILSEFVQEADQEVNDASGGNPITYKVFRYNPASDFTDGDFILTI